MAGCWLVVGWRLVPVRFCPLGDLVDGVRIHLVLASKRGLEQARILQGSKAGRVFALLDPALSAVVTDGDFDGIAFDLSGFHFRRGWLVSRQTRD